jgi:hypothetical protein
VNHLKIFVHAFEPDEFNETTAESTIYMHEESDFRPIIANLVNF